MVQPNMPVKKRGRGQPTKLLNPDIKNTILDLIRKGNYVKTACIAAGVSERVFYEWQKRAEAGGETGGGDDNVYVQFFRELKNARQANIAERVAKIQQAGEKEQNWTANAWLLERMEPGEYGKRMELEVGPSKVLVAIQEQAQRALEHQRALLPPREVIEGEYVQRQDES